MSTDKPDGTAPLPTGPYRIGVDGQERADATSTEADWEIYDADGNHIINCCCGPWKGWAALARRVAAALNFCAEIAIEDLEQWADKSSYERRRLAAATLTAYGLVRDDQNSQSVPWPGMRNLYRTITGKDCEENVALEMATLAVSNLITKCICGHPRSKHSSYPPYSCKKITCLCKRFEVDTTPGAPVPPLDLQPADGRPETQIKGQPPVHNPDSGPQDAPQDVFTVPETVGTPQNASGALGGNSEAYWRYTRTAIANISERVNRHDLSIDDLRGLYYRVIELEQSTARSNRELTRFRDDVTARFEAVDNAKGEPHAEK